MGTVERPKVSVVMPIYNTEAYLEQAVGCILRQTLRDLEIIAVDDGSTDGSPDMLERMELTDQRLLVYPQRNSGQSVARNVGVRESDGEYLYFFDSDDLVREDALQRCYEVAVSRGSDVVCFDGTFITEKGDEIDTPCTYRRKGVLDPERDYTGPEALEALLSSGCFSASPCLCFIRADYLEDIHLRFYPGIIHEDQLFTFLLYLCAERVAYVDEPLFFRRTRGGSTMTSPVSMRNVDGYLTVCREMEKTLARWPWRPVQRDLLRRQVRTLLGVAASTALPLPFGRRMQVLGKLLFRFFGKVGLPSVLLLLFPCLKRKKNKRK